MTNIFCHKMAKEFNLNIDELVILFNTTKHSIIRYLKKNFKENIHYIIDPRKKEIISGQRGGQNKITYLVDEETYELIKNTFNLKHRYIKKINECKIVNIIMSLENQTIGFIYNCFNNILNMTRQFPVGKYKIDLYFNDFNLGIECDEDGHIDRDIYYEQTREQYIELEGITLIRYNPNEKNFDLSNVISRINSIVFKK